jgi:hypothetical protein
MTPCSLVDITNFSDELPAAIFRLEKRRTVASSPLKKAAGYSETYQITRFYIAVHKLICVSVVRAVR